MNAFGRVIFIVVLVAACGVLVPRNVAQQRADDSRSDENGEATGRAVRQSQAEAPLPNAASRSERSAAASDSVTPDGSAPLRFRRVHVPAGKIQEFRREGLRYLPMPAAEFDERVMQLAPESDRDDRRLTQIVEADYEAVLDDDRQLIGSGTWTVRHERPEPVLLPIEPIGIPVIDAVWTGADSDRQARVGLTRDNIQALLVERAGAVRFSWSVRGSEGDEGRVYHFSLPPAAATRLTLALPAKSTPIVPGAVVTPMPVDEAQATTTGAADRQRWVIRLNDTSDVELRIVSADRRESRPSLTLFRPRTTYEISQQGLQVSAEWRLDVLGNPRDMLKLVLPAEISLVSVKLGDEALRWSETPVTSAGGAHKTVVLEFREPLGGSGRVLQLAAIAPLVSNRPWRLPQLQPEQVIWQEETATLIVAEPLLLNQLDLTRFRQTKRETLLAPRKGEAIALSALSANGAIDVEVAPAEERLQLNSATTIDLQANQALARYVAEVSSLRGEQARLVAHISPDWFIESVNSVPSGAITDWERGEGNANRLILHLAKTIEPDQPLRILVEAQRRRAPLGDTLGYDDLRLLTFEGVTAARRLVLMRTTPPFRLDLEQAESVVRLDPATVIQADRELLGSDPRGLLFALDENAEDLQLRLLAEAPQITANHDVHARLDNDALTETYSIRCVPDSQEIDRLTIALSMNRQSSLRWSLTGGRADDLVARRLSAEETSRTRSIQSGETWEIVFKRAQSEPFELTATRSTPPAQAKGISVSSIPEAASQRGRLMVESLADRVPQLHHHGFRSLPSPPAQPGRLQSVLGTFEYDPRDPEIFGGSSNFALTLPDTKAKPPAAWIWSCQLNSSFAPGGRIAHHARLHLETTGQRELRIRFPPIEGPPLIRVDGEEGSARFDENSGQAVVTLSSGRRFSTIELEWFTTDSALGAIAARTVVIPEFNIPVLSRQATIWLPPAYEVASAGGWELWPARTMPWRRRLFGPFGRPANQPTFTPWLVRDWSQLASGDSSREAARHVAQEFMAIVYPSSNDPSTGQRTAAERLYRAWYEASRRNEMTSIPLLVHISQIDRNQILRTADDSTAATSLTDIEPLHGLDLIVLIHGDTALLTTRNWAASAINHTIAVSTERVFDVEDGSESTVGPPNPYREAVAESTPLETWLGLPSGPAAPWSTASQRSADESIEGWVGYPVELPAGGSVSLWIIRPQSIVATAIAIFLATTAFAWRLGSFPAVNKAAVLAAAVILALLLPVPFTPLGAGLVLGIVAGLLCRLLPLQPDRAQAVHVVRAAPREIVGTAVALLIVCMIFPRAVAEEGKRPGEPASRLIYDVIYDVLIPVDDDLNSTGDSYLVPEPFFKELLRRTSVTPSASGRYLITSADYRGNWARGAQRNAGDDWRAELGVYTLDDAADVFLPMPDTEAAVVPDSMTLDGQPVRFIVDETRSGLLCSIPSKGDHRLQFDFRPHRDSSDRNAPVQTSLPRVASTRVKLAGIDLSALPKVNGIGRQWTSRQERILEIELGPRDRLRIEAASGEGKKRAARFRVKELSWLKIRPGSATLNARLLIDVTQGELSRLALRLDPRLKLIPPSTPGFEVRTTDVDRNEVEIQFARAVSAKAEIELSFVLLAEDQQPGTIAWPSIRVPEAEALRRIAACTADPILQLNAAPLPGMTQLAPAEIAGLWSTSTARPAVAYELGPGDSAWRVSIGMPVASLSARTQTLALVSRKKASVAYRTTCAVSGAAQDKVRFALPASVSIDRIDATVNGTPRSFRWGRASSGAVNLFFETPITGDIDVRMHGSLPVEKGGLLNLPWPQLHNGADNGVVVVIGRRSNALVQVDRPSGLAPLPANEAIAAWNENVEQLGLADDSAAKLLTVLQGNATSESIRLRVEPNRPRVNAIQALALYKTGDQWNAALALDLNIGEGLLDAIRLRIPTHWPGPFKVVPEMETNVVEVPGESFRELVLRPSQPIQGAAQVRITGPLNLLSGQRVRVPETHLLGSTELQRYYLLPREQELQQLAWDWRGLSVVSRAPDFVEKLRGEFPTTQLFAAGGEAVYAELRSIEKLAQDAQVRLSDISIAWQSDLSCYGVVAFDLEPAGLASCLLSLPSGLQPVGIRVDGLPQAVQPSAEDRWRIALGGGRLPQRIEVVFHGQLAAPARTPESFAAPRLVGIPIERTIWTISAPRWAGVPQLQSEPIDAARAELVRFESSAGLIESASNILADATPEDREWWFRPWLTRWLAARTSLSRHSELAPNAAAQRELIRRAELIEQEQRRLAGRLNLRPILGEVSGEPLLADSAVDLWNIAHGRTASPAYTMFVGESGSLVLTYHNSYKSDLPWRVFQALVAAGLLLVAAWTLERTRLVAYLRVRPRLVTAAAGIFWWLFLWPSIFGWFIVLLAAVGPYFTRHLRRLAIRRSRPLPA